MILHRIAFCPSSIQPILYFICFLSVCKFPFTNGNIPGELPSPACSWMPWWYESERCCAARSWARGTCQPCLGCGSCQSHPAEGLEMPLEHLKGHSPAGCVSLCRGLHPQSLLAQLPQIPGRSMIHRPNIGKPAVSTLIVKWIKTLIICEWWVLWRCLKGLACREKASHTQPGPLVAYGLLAAVSTGICQPNKMLHDHYAALNQLEGTFLNATEKCTSCCWIGFLPSKYEHNQQDIWVQFVFQHLIHLLLWLRRLDPAPVHWTGQILFHSQ